MLERLMDILRDGGTYSKPDLAERLGVGVPLVEMMLEDLERMGYLSPWDAACDSQCDTCPVGSCRVVGSSGKAWTFTDRERTRESAHE